MISPTTMTEIATHLSGTGEKLKTTGVSAAYRQNGGDRASKFNDTFRHSSPPVQTMIRGHDSNLQRLDRSYRTLA